VQRLELRPLLGLRVFDEVEDHGREDGALAVKAIARDNDVAVPEKVVLNYRLKRSL